MFPEYRELISQLKTENHRFQSLFDKHNDLDHEITKLEQGVGSDLEISQLKKEKLQIKDELLKILQTENAK
ncbi:MAG: DUF465 domain-containing protein [Vibrio sp.]